jgi:two-component system, NarL family, sensor kinase
MAAPVRLVLVDDHEMVIEGLKAMLAAFKDRVQVVGQAVGADRAVEVVDELQPDVVLCDVRMQGSSGLDLCKSLRERDAHRKVVMLSVYDDEQYLYQALRVGASGYLLKSINSDELVRQLELAHHGDTVIDPGMAARAADTAARMQRDEFWPGARQGLTQRESEILSCMVNGLSNRGIANKLVIGEETVKSHLRAIYRKLGVNDRTRGPHAVHDLVDTDRELALLRELIQAASTGPGVGPLAAAAARMITAATGTDVCFVHVLDDSDRSLTLAGATPPFDGQVGKIRLPLGSGISGWVARHRKPVVIIHDKEADPRYLPIQSLRGRDFTSMVSMPMETDPGGLVGVLNVHTVARREFTDGDVELLRVIGRLIAGAMHQARLHRQLVVRERSHELFVEQVIEAQEIERRRVAGDIHDGISQRLITLSYWLDAAARTVGTDPGEASRQLAEARELVGLTLGEARAAISGLRPPVLDDLGLAGGLASLARSIPQLDVELELADVRLPEHIEIALYRIAQEGLQNIVKHANASVARLRFALDDDTARLEIVDNGIGFDTFENPLGGDEMGGYGVLSMAERAELVGGRLNIRSRPGSGTTVTATIPMPSLMG